jgi:hypothetical protein
MGLVRREDEWQKKWRPVHTGKHLAAAKDLVVIIETVGHTSLTDHKRYYDAGFFIYSTMGPGAEFG